MTIQDPGTMEVECNGCGETKEFNTTQYADCTFGVEEATVEAEGWIAAYDEHYCPKCREEQERAEDSTADDEASDETDEDDG